ncbi:MAG TPA: ATP-binding protein [Roseiflexaceae bacterium]|nr:ATP-binding protein [Roseiflexaceae bacterium]HMP39223.1 ATP-binding protein [Roseiflexaceae bacterium]
MLSQRTGTIAIYTLLIAASLVELLVGILFPPAIMAIIIASSIALVIHLALLGALLAGRPLPPQIAIVMSVLLIGVALPPPYVSEISSLIVIMPALIAMAFAGPVWIIGSGMAIWGMLIWRAGGQGVYLEIPFITAYTLILAWLVLTRMVLNAARSETEAALIHADEQRLALEHTNTALEASEARLRRIIEDNPLPMMIHAADGEVIQINAAWANLSGYSHADIPTITDWTNLAYGERGSLEKAAIEQLYGIDNPVAEGEDRIRTRYGTERVWKFSSAPLGTLPDGRRIVISSAADITERKRFQEELIAERAVLAQRIDERTLELRRTNRELERALQLRDEFLAVMSHELRTPLTSVLGFTEMLQAEAYGPLTPRQRQVLTTIGHNGSHLLALISNILDFARISAGQIEIDPQLIDIEQLCEGALQLIHNTAHKRQIEIQRSIGLIGEPLVADELRLRQILVNLLENALKFSVSGGRIGLDVTTDAEHHTICFSVWDEGPGIAADQLERIFLPFVQLDTGPTRRYEGTGLGLALVYELVRMHGGSIDVVSDIGRGSRFSVRLPLTTTGDVLHAVQHEPPGTPAASITFSQTTLLIVEDHDETRALFSELFSRAGHRVIAVHNGQDALIQARDANPDAMLIDIQIPGVDGLEVIRTLRSSAETARLPIVAVTALSLPEDRERCLAAGADSYLAKPVSLPELRRTIERLLTRS